MEEDIKILESIIKVNNDYLEDIKHQTINQKEIKAIKHILSDYKRALEMNEVLLKENKELKNDYENLNNSVVVKNYYIKNSIPIQKIKDKIEEIQEEGYWLFTTDRDSDKCVEVLQQLLGKEQ